MKSWHFAVVLSSVLLIVAVRTLYYQYYENKKVITSAAAVEDTSSVLDAINKNFTGIALHKTVTSARSISTLRPIALPTTTTRTEPCNDLVWCKIAMPNVSYFKFGPPTDQYRWRKAQIQAANGEQVLLKRTIKVFPNHADFLDGDIYFRKHNTPVDIFVDKKRDLSALKTKIIPHSSERRQLGDFDWEGRGKVVIPPNYDFASAHRAPIVKLGYFAFAQDGGSLLFEGPRVGEATMELHEFLEKWKAVKNEIQSPFVAMHSANENWGLLSTYFPNRTIDWGSCCTGDKRKDLEEFLNHPMTLMLVVGQHSNFSHPKIVTLPRGMPIWKDHSKRIIWDTMREVVRKPKNQLVFTAASTWGPRPQIIACVNKKFTDADFKGISYTDSHSGNRVGPNEYYKRLGTARLGLALSGLGTDTFRLWEALTMGTVPVVEKGFGLDKTLWRLPALLVEDFDQVTPELLRTAYVEALYRADDFEFERLTQSFWWSFIMNVSVTMSSQTVLDKFPLEADDPDFMRPFVPFTCWETNSCGKGTKRIPKTSC